MSKYQYKVNGADYTVEIGEIEGAIAQVTVNGKQFEVELPAPVKAPTRVKRVEAAPAAAAPAPAPERAKKPKAAAGSGTKVLAPLPGTITEMKVAVGDSVRKGDTVVILEAMKMQNNIEAECDGTITSVLVSRGDTVMEGAALVTIG
ncbi:MAG: acetyl-CoA carboxylase biotin carboxyl carrier protein subunit [Prevotella sp.]|nr:acetyl-CoA carboxylase biotin carboxyl carrier protein subunit [Prevotella sp.]MBQ4294267.1 acetyl-CoA carboxylase biotin carboxyl carrier protein subunit [Prevotella sp.]